MLINSIFNSIDGEVNHFGQGTFTTFIRLQGCNLRCSYCDTLQAQEKEGSLAKKMTPLEIVKYVKATGYNKITITGGEPLEQKKELFRLLEFLNREEIWDISIETNGSKSFLNMRNMASWVVDYKLPSSGMKSQMNYDAFANLGSDDTIKFVVANRDDFIYAINFIKDDFPGNQHPKEYPMIAFSPVFKRVKASTLFNWVKESCLPKTHRIALNIQLHKIIDLP
jgi:7-carboxy-7-deazaguanine synthase